MTPAPNHWGRLKVQQYRKYFLQYKYITPKRPQAGTWGRQTCFLDRAPSNLVMPLRRKPGRKYKELKLIVM